MANPSQFTKIWAVPRKLNLRGKAERARWKFVRLLLSRLSGSARVVPCLLAEDQAFCPQQVLLNYAQGLFPMGSKKGIKWDNPSVRAVLPVNALHVPKNLARIVRQERFAVTFDRDFPAVIRACANREKTWISPEVIEVYLELQRWGVAHSVEAWQDNRLVGGSYGVALGSLFVGESMFHHVSEASKVAFVHLVEHLKNGGFSLVDCQYLSPWMESFGAVQISWQEYKKHLAKALTQKGDFLPR